MKNVLAVFKHIASVNDALKDLERMGFTKNEVSVVVSRESIGSEDLVFKENTLESVKDTAVTGGVIGGVLGLLVGLGAIAIPGLGLLFITGPIAAALGIGGVAGTTLSGALTGSLVGGVAGALVNMGVSEELAVEYERDLKSGNIVLGVETPDDKLSAVRDVLHKNGATRVTDIRVKNYA